jgi:type I restriction enzyme S subunit
MSELPQGWAEVAISEITETIPNMKPEDEPEREFAYVDISAVDNATFRVTETKRFLGKEAPSRARRPVKPYDVIFSNVRTYLRNIALITEETEADLCSTGFTVLRPNEAVDPRYLFRYVLSDAFIDSVTPQQTGTHYPATSDRVVMGEMISLPPLTEQRRIVAKLEQVLTRVEACRARLETVPTLLKRFRQSVLAAACSGRLTEDWREEHQVECEADQYLCEVSSLREEVWSERKPDKSTRKCPVPTHHDANNLPDIPDTWRWVSADSVCAQITDGEHIQPPYQVEGYPMLSAKHVREGFVDMKGAGLISADDFRKALARCAPEEGDILIVSVGATTGRSAIVENCPPFAIVRSVLLFKPIIPSRYFLFWTQCPWCFSWMTNASGASAQPHFYIKDAKRMPIPLPPLDEQQEIVRRITALFALADGMEARYTQAKTHVDRLTQSILAKAFRGELVPQDPADEPAVAFLARIRESDGGRKKKH